MSHLLHNSDVVIVGAGPAGLAVSACLKKADISSVILEQNSMVGSAWHRHYDRLHLHTDKQHSELPFLPYPKQYPRYLSRTQMIDYLESYARTFDLDVRFGQEVVLACQKNDQWEVQTRDSVYRTPNLVIAAGYAREAVRPTWQGQDLFQGRVLHSSEYTNGEPFRGQRVLVVGFGNSGGEIAVDLWEHAAKPGIAVRSAVNVIPRELFGIPILSIAILQSKLPAQFTDAINAPILRAIIGDITRYGLRKLPYGPRTQVRKDQRIPLIDVGTMKLIREGQIEVYEGIAEFTAEGIRFVDGKQARFDVVVLATGFRPRVDRFLQAALGIYDQEGTPLVSGQETSLPGLYFCGYHITPTGGLREIGIEARHISESIASRKTS